MDFCSQIVRNVKLPPSLSDTGRLTEIHGGIILKDAVGEDEGLRVEGDLLWEGFALAEHGKKECIWEGAEYFTEILAVPELRLRDPFMLEPEITEVTAASGGEGSCDLTFSVRWWEEERQSEEKENFEQELMEINQFFRDTVTDFVEAGEADSLFPEAEEEEKENAEITGAVSTPLAKSREEENKVTEICNDFRELRKKAIPSQIAYSVESAEELLPSTEGTCYCMHFYRASKDDTLETVAQRFSVSLAKMRRVNELDEVGSIGGRLVRLPK